MSSLENSLSLTGTVKISTALSTSTEVLSSALEDVSHYGPHTRNLDAGDAAGEVITVPGGGNSSYVRIECTRPIRVRFSGGTEDFTINRIFVAFMEVSQVELFNDLSSPAEPVYVTVSYAVGGELV